jgi:hypothetical protein
MASETQKVRPLELADALNVLREAEPTALDVVERYLYELELALLAFTRPKP